MKKNDLFLTENLHFNASWNIISRQFNGKDIIKVEPSPIVLLAEI
jgi:hypothetical protein